MFFYISIMYCSYIYFDREIEKVWWWWERIRRLRSSPRIC
jgi:hypothetical protein